MLDPKLTSRQRLVDGSRVPGVVELCTATATRRVLPSTAGTSATTAVPPHRQKSAEVFLFTGKKQTKKAIFFLGVDIDVGSLRWAAPKRIEETTTARRERRIAPDERFHRTHTRKARDESSNSSSRVEGVEGPTEKKEADRQAGRPTSARYRKRAEKGHLNSQIRRRHFLELSRLWQQQTPRPLVVLLLALSSLSLPPLLALLSSFGGKGRSFSTSFRYVRTKIYREIPR